MWDFSYQHKLSTMRIYLDHAASTPVLPAVLEEMMPYFIQNYGNPSSTHAEGRACRAAIEQARKQVAKRLGVHPASVVFTSGGTESNNLAIKSCVRKFGIKRLISSPIEHSCVKATVNSVCMQSAQIELISLQMLPNGQVDMEHLERVLADNPDKAPSMLSLIHAHNELGSINPVAEIARLCQKYDTYFHTDTVQSLHLYDLNLANTPIHFCSSAGHKIGAPKGVGILYVDKKLGIPALIDGGHQERGMRAGTENVAGIVAYAKALELSLDNASQHLAYMDALRKRFVERLKNLVPTTYFNGNFDQNYQPSILNISIPSALDAAMLLFKLDLAGISASGGAACQSGSVQTSTTGQFLNRPAGFRTLRFSFADSNTFAEIDQAVDTLAGIVLEGQP